MIPFPCINKPSVIPSTNYKNDLLSEKIQFPTILQESGSPKKPFFKLATLSTQSSLIVLEPEKEFQNDFDFEKKPNSGVI